MIVVTVDFNSDEALYMQLCNQIILGIATSQIQEGDSLPSVRLIKHILYLSRKVILSLTGDMAQS